jgi:hypothetical protein
MISQAKVWIIYLNWQVRDWTPIDAWSNSREGGRDEEIKRSKIFMEDIFSLPFLSPPF